jgi:hypothetical protein
MINTHKNIFRILPPPLFHVFLDLFFLYLTRFIFSQFFSLFSRYFLLVVYVVYERCLRVCVFSLFFNTLSLTLTLSTIARALRAGTQHLYITVFLADCLFVCVCVSVAISYYLFFLSLSLSLVVCVCVCVRASFAFGFFLIANRTRLSRSPITRNNNNNTCIYSIFFSSVYYF